MPEMHAVGPEGAPKESAGNLSEQVDNTGSIEGLQRRIDRLTVAVIMLALITLVSTAVVFGQLVNWFAGQALLQGGVSLGGTLLGFGVGWFAGRRFG